MVVSVSRGLEALGDRLQGSGEVPHDELGAVLVLEEAEGELVAPESRLDLDVFTMLLLVRGGVKAFDILDRSSAVLARPTRDVSRGLTWLLVTALAVEVDLSKAGGDVVSIVDGRYVEAAMLAAVVAAVDVEGPGSCPNLGNSN